ncbi:MAG: hypothetical protein ACRC0V_01945 [Fusobacteriaceae bacterium]
MKKFLFLSAILSLSTLAMAKESVTAPTLDKEVMVEKVEATFPTNFAIFKVDTFGELAAVPSFSLGAPAGMVPGWGVAFAGLSGRTNSSDTDGSLALGMGFGNPLTSLGGAATLAVGSIDPRDGGAGNRGSLNLSTGKHFPKYGLGTSVGITNIDLWHADSVDTFDPSFYASVTKLLPNSVAPVILTAGFGNNVYSDSKSENDLKNKIGGFAAAAVYLMPQLSLIADYTSGSTTAGIGFAPFPKLPISFTMGASDIFEHSNDNKVSFIASVSAAYTF